VEETERLCLEVASLRESLRWSEEREEKLRAFEQVSV
jgi:hypothetical protein